MNWRTYRIELLTPTLLAGADPLKAEMRVPSIRGQLRWWFRALGGKPEQEEKIFGGIRGPLRSLVRLRILDAPHSYKTKNLLELVGSKSPQAYLLWPLRKENRRGMFKPGGTFTLAVSLNPKREQELEDSFYAALHAWILLGSLGTRSRRGYGSLGPASIKEHGFPHATDSLEAYRRALEQILPTFKQNRFKAVTLGAEKENPEDALDALAKWLKNFRATKYIKNPFRWAVNDHDGGPGGVLYRPVIGLPLEQRYSNGRKIKTRIKAGDRWASPVHLKVIRCGRLYYSVALFFPEMAMPDGRELTLLEQGRKEQKKCADQGLFREMMKVKPEQVLWNSVD